MFNFQCLGQYCIVEHNICFMDNCVYSSKAQLQGCWVRQHCKVTLSKAFEQTGLWICDLRLAKYKEGLELSGRISTVHLRSIRFSLYYLQVLPRKCLL